MLYLLQMCKKMMQCNKCAITCNKCICNLTRIALVLQQKPKVGIANKHFKNHVRKLVAKVTNALRKLSAVS